MSSAVASQRAKREPLCVLSGALLLALGCAGRTPPPATAQKVVTPPARLTWLPAESISGGKLAKSVNEELGQVSLPGAAAGVKSAVSMEVAQLAIECTEPTPRCYTAVGRSLGADEMVWAELGVGHSSRDVRVALLLYDVRVGAAPKRVERTFDNVEAARAGVSSLVQQLKTEGGPR
jgi:hypothetical protein